MFGCSYFIMSGKPHSYYCYYYYNILIVGWRGIWDLDIFIKNTKSCQLSFKVWCCEKKVTMLEMVLSWTDNWHKIRED